MVNDGAAPEVALGPFAPPSPEPQEFHRRLPGYAPTPLVRAPGLAERGLPQPSVAVAQIGVGALAAAVRHYRTGRLAPPPRLLGVEPADAGCMLASVAAGCLVEVPGPHRSIVAGLNCGRASPLAFPLASGAMDAFVAVDDDAARRAVSDLAAAGVVAGESGAAGVAGLSAVLAGRHPNAEEARRALGLDGASTVLVVSTEGATDPEAYASIVGSAPTEAP